MPDKKDEKVNEKPKAEKIVVEGLEDATAGQLLAVANALEQEASNLEETEIKNKREKASLIRRKLLQMSDECGCSNFTSVNDTRGRGRIVIECNICKTRYIAMRGM